MNRRTLLKWIGLAPALSLAGTASRAEVKVTSRLGKEDWRKLLPPESYRVLFEEATERATTLSLIHI